MRRKILFLCTLLLIVGAVGTFFVLPHTSQRAHASGGSDWTMFQGDLGHSGFNQAETTINASNVSKLKLQWQRKAGGSISSQVVEANGRLYWGSWDGLEHATNPADGTDYWTTPVGVTTPTNTSCNPKSAGPSGAAAIATVTINGNPTSVAFVSGGDAKLYALDATTGAKLWSTPLGTGAALSNMLWAGPVYYNGAVYVGVASYGDCPLIQGQMFKLDAATGNVLNTYNVVPPRCIGGGIWDTPTIDQATGMLYVSTGTYANSCKQTGNEAEGLLELNSTDLSLVGWWQVPPNARITDSDFGSTPTLFQATISGVVHQMVGLVNKNGIYYAFDRSNVSAGPLWSVRLSDKGNSFSSSGWDGTTLYAADATTTINGTSCPGSLRALDPATGAFLWQDCLSSGVQSSIMITPGLVSIGAGANIIVVDATTGNQLFNYHDASGGGARFVSTPTIINGALYQGSLNGNFFALGLSSSTPTPTPSPSGTPFSGTIFQDNFDSYSPGPLPTGTGANQWSSVKTSGTGFAVGVSNAQSHSAPNSLQFTMGSGLKGYAWAKKLYGTGFATHAAKFAVYLDSGLTFSNQPIALFTSENHTNTQNGSMSVLLNSNRTLEVVWYDSTGKKHTQNLGTTNSLSSGQWYTLELDQTNNAVSGSWSFWLNGMQIASLNNIDMGDTAIDAIIAGDTLNSTSSMSGSYYEDDVVTATQHIG